MINGKHSEQRPYDGRTSIKKFTFSERQRSLLHARSTLDTPCEQGWCCGICVSCSWGISMVFIPAGAQHLCLRSWSRTENWVRRRLNSEGLPCSASPHPLWEGLMFPSWCQQARQLCIVRHRLCLSYDLMYTRAPSGYVTQHVGSQAWMCRKRKSLQSYVNLGQIESVTAVISSSLAFLSKTFEYNIPLHWFPAEISIKNLYIAAL